MLTEQCTRYRRHLAGLLSLGKQATKDLEEGRLASALQSLETIAVGYLCLFDEIKHNELRNFRRKHSNNGTRSVARKCAGASRVP